MTTDLEIGFELDRRWHYLRGEMEQSKKPALYALARIFAEAEVPYAVIGGIAFQVRADAPRTTLDIDVAVVDRVQLPRERLLAEGFVETGSFPDTVNWQSRDGTPVQFSDDPFFRGPSNEQAKSGSRISRSASSRRSTLCARSSLQPPNRNVGVRRGFGISPTSTSSWMPSQRFGPSSPSGSERC